MTKWYDRIGNTIEMLIDGKWIKGIIVNGERSGDGIINMETLTGQKYWCGSAGEYIHFRKCDDSDGDLLTNADRIRSMSDEELAEYICNISKCAPDYCPAYKICMRTEYGTINKWLQSEAE